MRPSPESPGAKHLRLKRLLDELRRHFEFQFGEWLDRGIGQTAVVAAPDFRRLRGVPHADRKTDRPADIRSVESLLQRGGIEQRHALVAGIG